MQSFSWALIRGQGCTKFISNVCLRERGRGRRASRQAGRGNDRHQQEFMDSSTVVDENNIIHCPSSNAWMAVLEDSIIQNKLVVTMYYASWSAPSKVMYDTMVQLAKVVPNVMFSKLDIDEAKDITMRMAVRIVPTIIFVQGGKEVGRVKRVVSSELLQQKILSLLQPQQT